MILHYSRLANNELMKVQPKRSANIATNLEKYLILIGCFEGPPSFTINQNYLLEILMHLLELLQKILKGKTLLIIQFLHELRSTLKALATILELLVKLGISKIQENLKQLAINSSIQNLLKGFYKRWSKDNSILTNSSFILCSRNSNVSNIS